MSTEEIKQEIWLILDTLPDDALTHILAYLKRLQSQDEDQIQLARDLEKIFSEDKGLFERLADS